MFCRLNRIQNTRFATVVLFLSLILVFVFRGSKIYLIRGNYDVRVVDSVVKTECVRDCISGYNLRCPPVSQNIEIFRMEPKLKVLIGETAKMRQESFKKVYLRYEWYNRGDTISAKHRYVQGSGAGSTVDWAVEAMAVLHLLISDLKRHLGKSRLTLLDVPCGDMLWMSRFLQSRTDIDYTGVDIVPKLIAYHKRMYPRWKFMHQDIVETPLNKSYDIVFSRMMLQHLKSIDVLKVLQHFQNSGSKYLLTTTFPGVPINGDLRLVQRGRFRQLNLELPPVSLSPPICMTRDGDTERGKLHYLGLWKFPLWKYKKCSKRRHRKHQLTQIDFFACG